MTDMAPNSPSKPTTSRWWNWLLLAAGAGGVLAPDLSNLNVLLDQHGLGWVLNVIHILGAIALLAAGWSRLQTWLPASKLWNRILLTAGIANIITPDLTGLSDWLSSLHIGWLTHVAHTLGGLALFATTWSRIVGKIAKQLPKNKEIPITTTVHEQ